ncbi:aspartate ammonia-lyase [Arthrobacter sp. ISL-28]|uniref:aspartate ammonia-lyase n=1 Tax=Arthrobacter sp. ISL-28 TaxID=2819108 RepID=UPI001BE6BAC7|nr:aspartate ammonia-lyase [Arthrobacter sp. ISL-28]MBT2519438.1 aspartate ammonia-lyase [Arthrobacter sp. ISL-28]
METRNEKDLLGSLAVPAEAYYGVHTARAQQNFRVTDTSISQFPELISALASVKQAATLANSDLKVLNPTLSGAIVQACEEIREGALHGQFILDPIQGGAGTSTNMNANEVIANRALEILGHARGDYQVLSPLEHVNRGHSTNDVYPTALRIATILAAQTLLIEMDTLRTSFERKAAEFAPVVKMGRTQLQDAVPMTLGQEFSTYAVMVEEDQQRLRDAMALLHEINLGATAIGTGITASPGYAEAACMHLRQITGLPLQTAPNLVEATQDCGSFVQFSGVLKRIAVKLSKVCNDLRLLSSGPRAGFSEMNLPPRQAGSSIMPGKVNPVIPELVNQIAFEVIGNDLTVTMAAEAGQLQLNAFEPVIGYSILKSCRRLAAGAKTLAELCIDGITANEDFLRSQVENSIGTVTVLNPYIGYEAATAIAKEALVTGRTITSLVLERKLLDAQQLTALLSPSSLASPPRALDQNVAGIG